MMNFSSWDLKKVLKMQASVRKQCLSHVYRWLFMNKLRLNVSETNQAIFYRKEPIILIVLSTVTLITAAFERKEVVNFLGVYLDEGLNWTFHIVCFSKIFAGFPNVLFRTSRCLDTSSKKIIHSSLFYPK